MVEMCNLLFGTM